MVPPAFTAPVVVPWRTNPALRARVSHPLRRPCTPRLPRSPSVVAVASDPTLTHQTQPVVSTSLDHATAPTAAPLSVDGEDPLTDAGAADSEISSLDDISELIDLAEEFDLRDFRIAHNGVAVQITRPGGRGFDNDGNLNPVPEPHVIQGVDPAVTQPAFAPQGGVGNAPPAASNAPVADVARDGAPATTSAAAVDGEAAKEVDADTVQDSDFVVTSNRVGFFFCGAKNKPPLVNVGDRVAFNQPVCIIEQLGQQYVYLSEASGTVLKVFVEDGDAVEYGTQIMAIRPDT